MHGLLVITLLAAVAAECPQNPLACLQSVMSRNQARRTDSANRDEMPGVGDALKLFMEEWEARRNETARPASSPDDTAETGALEQLLDGLEDSNSLNCTRCWKPGDSRERRLQELKALKQFMVEWEARHNGSSWSSGEETQSPEMQAQSGAPGPMKELDEAQTLALMERGQRDDLDVDGNTLNCTRCMKHGDARERRLQEIKMDILNKLGLKQAPNVTSKALPRIPPLHHLLDRYGMVGEESEPGASYDEDSASQMAGDMPFAEDEEEFEEFYVNAERSISFSQLRK